MGWNICVGDPVIAGACYGICLPLARLLVLASTQERRAVLSLDRRSARAIFTRTLTWTMPFAALALLLNWLFDEHGDCTQVGALTFVAGAGTMTLLVAASTCVGRVERTGCFSGLLGIGMGFIIMSIWMFHRLAK